MVARSRLTLFMTLLSFLACTSTKELPLTLKELRANVEIEDVTTPSFASRSIRVVLSNKKGKDVEREDVKVEVNGTPMRFGVSQGNYYDRHPYYRLDDKDNFSLTPSSDYKFVLTLPDGTRHDIGTVRTPAALLPNQFDFATNAPVSRPVIIAWRDLVEPVEIRVGRTEQRRDSSGSVAVEGGGPNDPEAMRKTVGPGLFRKRSDRWELPERLLVSTADNKLLSLQVEITATNNGRASSEISNKSTLTATRRIQLAMEFAKFE